MLNSQMRNLNRGKYNVTNEKELKERKNKMIRQSQFNFDYHIIPKYSV